MSCRRQHLVNAQVDVNRAVFAENERRNGNPHAAEVSDEYIAARIQEAIDSLEAALDGYQRQQRIFGARA